ncbi:uncharacterized protein I303_104730 [Kwoniella dejecticola CBS 10117]|uniref:Histone deacetylase domain-containing protein n=1 Tax=Kwoniella dejecticola CBS 10117 TaxID=1296121 RepID=A0A1A6A4H9_9TREE|nr:uncharacterized protein I303_04290 [Kwoniella dejecticola CBS 10117]OBR84964.1 hypothetical protein I303_04290 [Kwoniella dejecticola CBS 10117]
MASASAPRVSYIWSQELQDVSDDLPSNIGRSSMVHGLIRALDLLERESSSSSQSDDGPAFNRASIVAPDEHLGTEDCMLKYHDKDYIDALLRPRSSPPAYNPTAPRGDSDSDSAPAAKRARTKGPGLQEYRDMDRHNLSHDNPPFPTLPRYASLVAASTSTACRLLIRNEADFVVCWDGGRHHARKHEAGGFCYVNDLVLALLLLSKEGKIALKPEEQKPRVKSRPPRILYLDMDLHYSDGVSSAFHSTKEYPDPMPTKNPPKPPNVMTFSLHHLAPGFYPPSTPWADLTNPWLPTPFSLAIPLKAYTSSQTYKTIWEGCVEPVVKEWDPDFIVLQMGADGLPGDRVGQFGNWSVEGEGGMKWCIDRVKKWGKKTCITGGGGYNHPNTARAWASITASLLNRPTNAETPIPHHDHFEEYAHSFTMEVPAGHMEDQNNPKYIARACEDFDYIASRIQDIVASSLR